MTKEEAIQILHPDTSADSIAKIAYYSGFRSKEAVITAIEEACKIACNALKKEIQKEGDSK